jgi:hypothetical protein
MAYRETRQRCKVCGRETVHWRPWFELRPAFHAKEWPRAIAALLRSLPLPGMRQWRCLECDHPWDFSLLRGDVPLTRPVSSRRP